MVSAWAGLHGMFGYRSVPVKLEAAAALITEKENGLERLPLAAAARMLAALTPAWPTLC